MINRRTFFAVVLILIVLVLARNIIIRACLEEGMRVVTGLRLDIGKFNMGILHPTLTLENLKLYNPSGYKDPVMMDVGQIHLRYKPLDILRGQVYLGELRISLRELFIIRRTRDQLNYDALNAFQSHGNGHGADPLTIDNFTLTIGKVIYKDYAHGATPLVKTYDLDLNEHYSGIRGASELAHLIMVGVLDKTSIASLIKVDLNKLKKGLSSTLIKSLQVSDNSINGLLGNL